MAAEAGRDPQALRTVLRVYPLSPDTMDGVVDTIRRAEESGAVDHVFVETMNIADTADQGLEAVESVLRKVRG